ncbi:MAG TPA: hypothetical protein VF814_11605 [Casimicrobiaceae bacterium]
MSAAVAILIGWPAKGSMPLIMLARLGDKPAASGSYKHDENLVAITGVIVEHDAGKVSLAAAAEKLKAAGVRVALYATPSSEPEAPRWRCICPASRELHPRLHEQLVGRLAAILGDGVLSAESWRVGQSYYFGRVEGKRNEYAVIDGERCIDELDIEPLSKCSDAVTASRSAAFQRKARAAASSPLTPTAVARFHAADRILPALKAAGLYIAENLPGVHRVTCPGAHHHGRRPGGTFYYSRDGGVARAGGFHCFHTHCSYTRLARVREWLDERGYLAAPVPLSELLRLVPLTNDERKQLAGIVVDGVSKLTEAQARPFGLSVRQLRELLHTLREQHRNIVPRRGRRSSAKSMTWGELHGYLSTIREGTRPPSRHERRVLPVVRDHFINRELRLLLRFGTEPSEEIAARLSEKLRFRVLPRDVTRLLKLENIMLSRLYALDNDEQKRKLTR